MALSNSHFQLKIFDELNNQELYQIMQLRNQVFVLEQACAYQDLDGLDQSALHLLSKADSGQIISYARILKPNQCNNTHCSIGRVVVSAEFRQQNLGRLLMQTAIEHARQKFPNIPLKISAQTYLTHFYLALGFVNSGHFYLEDMIPHQEMIYQPK